MNLTFRTILENNDIIRIMEIVESTGFFYDHEIEVAVAVELITDRLAHGESSGQEHYLPNRAFYDNNNFLPEARLKDF
jgi:hypothetical protein